MGVKQTKTGILPRLWLYQQERFPVGGHGLLIAAFSFSALNFSALLRGQGRLPDTAGLLVGFASAFLFFLQLRISDEFKDYDDDSHYRPYRPVPRGLVTLGELGALGLLTACLQLGLALWLEPGLVWLLLLVWAYLALMSKEFFAGEWLKARPLLYMISHMLIMPLIDFYTTACDWLPAGSAPPYGLTWFLVISYFNGVVIEMGRKIRAPGDEETGVETYSALWGRGPAVLAWLGALLLTAASAWLAAVEIQAPGLAGWLLAALLLAAAVTAARFLRLPVTVRARQIEKMAGLWTIGMYLGVGILPIFGRQGW